MHCCLASPLYVDFLDSFGEDDKIVYGCYKKIQWLSLCL